MGLLARTASSPAIHLIGCGTESSVSFCVKGRETIAAGEPFAGDALVVVDTCGQSRCEVASGSRSRGNDMGADLAVELARCAVWAGASGVAIITPTHLSLRTLPLRQQLAAYDRCQKRVHVEPRERMFWLALSKVWAAWRSALIIVKPDTVIAWHRRGFQRYWRWRSRNPGRPGIPAHYPKPFAFTHPAILLSWVIVPNPSKVSVRIQPNPCQ